MKKYLVVNLEFVEPENVYVKAGSSKEAKEKACKEKGWKYSELVAICKSSFNTRML